MNSVTLTISYETLLQLVDQLSPEQRRALAAHLRGENGGGPLNHDATAETDFARWRANLEAMMIDVPVGPEWSDRREDWYDDDDR
jgi:hypothetical protein